MLVYHLRVPLLWTDGEALCDGRENSSAFGRQELEEERQGGAQDTVYFQGMPIVTHLLKRPYLLNLPSYCGSMEVNPLIR